jgi:hypothetical protein
MRALIKARTFKVFGASQINSNLPARRRTFATHLIYESAGFQQPQNRFKPNALLVHERHSVDFSTRIVIGSHKSQGDDFSRPRVLPMIAPMFLSSRFTFPLPAGAAYIPHPDLAKLSM